MSMQQVTEGQANPEVVINRNSQTLEHQSVYGQRQSAHSGLTWGYYGGRWGGFSVADGTLSLTDASTNYVVVLRSNGVISVSTSNTNWNDTTNYARVYRITTSGGVVTNNTTASDFDYRVGPFGVHGQSNSGGSGLTDGDKGDITVSGSGATWTIDNDVVNYAKMQNVSGASLLLGRGDSGSGDPQEITLGTNLSMSGTTLNASAGGVSDGDKGDITVSSSGTVWTIDNDSVSNAKLANMANSTIKGRTTSGTGDPEDLTAAQAAAIVQGDGLTVDLAGFRGIPQNSQSAAYTLVAADAGKHVYHPSSDANARTFTIPANGSVAFPIGTSVTFINETSQVVTIAITTDTLVLAGTGSTGSRSLAQYGVATAVKVTSTRWYISGTGLT